MEKQDVTVRQDDLMPSSEREWTETTDDLMIHEPWGMPKEEFLEELSACSGIRTPTPL